MKVLFLLCLVVVVLSQNISPNLSLQPYGKDTFYVTTIDGSIYKLDDFDTGHPTWRFDTGDNIVASHQNGNSFLIPSIRGNLYQFNSTTGIRKMKLNVRDLVNLSPFTPSPDSIWMGSKSSSVYVLDFYTGNLICKYKLNEFGQACQSSIQKSETKPLLLIRNDFSVHSIDPVTSNLQWNLTWSEILPIQSSKLNIPSSHLVFSTSDGLLYIQDSKIQNVLKFDSQPISLIRVIGQNHEIIHIPSLSNKDRVFINQYQNGYYATETKKMKLPDHGLKFLPSTEDVSPLVGEHDVDHANPPIIHDDNRGTILIVSSIVLVLVIMVQAYVFYFKRTVKVEPPAMSSTQTIGIITLNLEKQLGRGSNGTIVYEGSLNDGRSVAIKRMLKEFYEIANKEISILIESDHHQNIIRYYAKEQDDQFLYLAFELCQHSLDDIDKVDTKKFTIPKIMFDMAISMDHLHTLNIVHRDLKPGNILIKDGIVKVSDMGLSKKLDKHSMTASISGTRGWVAPEILKETGRMTKQVDVFSLGCLYYYLATRGLHPFGDPISREVNIVNGNHSIEIENVLLKHLIKNMIQIDPEKRYTMKQVLKHPFFWSEVKRLDFIINVSELMSKEKDSVVNTKLDLKKKQVFETTWDLVLDPVLIENVTKKRKYDYSSIIDLIRLWRNLRSHYREYDEKVQALLEPLPDGIFSYFDLKFPNLFLIIYNGVKHTWNEELREYF